MSENRKATLLPSDNPALPGPTETLEKLVRAYQNQEPGADEALLDNEYVWGIVIRLSRLMLGKAPYSRKDALSRNWYSAWASKEQRAILRSKGNQKEVNEVAQSIASRASKLISSVWDYEDCIQEIQMAIIEMAQRYTNKNASFHTYLVTTLPHKILNRARRLFNDSMAYLGTSIDDDEASPYLHSGLADQDRIEDDSATGSTWIAGLTSSEVFDTLTSEERFILYRMMLEGETPEEVAKSLGISKSTLYLRRRRAIDKIIARGEELNLVKKPKGDESDSEN